MILFVSFDTLIYILKSIRFEKINESNLSLLLFYYHAYWLL